MKKLTFGSQTPIIYHYIYYYKAQVFTYICYNYITKLWTYYWFLEYSPVICLFFVTIKYSTYSPILVWFGFFV